MAALALPFAAPALAGGIGSALAGGASAATQTAIGNAIIQGAMSEATGGDFLKGAALSGVNSLAGNLQPGLSEALGGGAFGNIAADALIGGGISELSGGDFASGALTSGVLSGINQSKLAAADEYLSNFPGGHGQYSDAPPDMSDFADLNPASFQIGDTTFTPDYSLGRGTSGAPGLTVAPIDTEYQVGSFDYSLGDLIDGLGLKMPNTPNIESMGGGQGIVIKTTDGYITESGFVPNSYVASLGDPESFINKPVVDVQLSLSELQSTNESDLNKKLAGLDIAKALTPYALAALTKRAYDQSREDGAASGFAIVPIPEDWRSPEYNMAFTPSAPIDFGSPEMLAGTQWAAQPTVAMAQQPMDVSTLLNTLNIQQTEQMPQFGMDQVVGNINDVPMSINDIISSLGQNTMQPFDMNRNFGQLNNAPASLNSIIAGIQSQYG
jgi:hypothetical protein